MSTDFINRPRGATSNKPNGAAVRIARLRCSSVAPAARARSLASPAAVPTPNNAPAPVATAAVGAATGSAAIPAAIPAIGAANPAIEPKVCPILYEMSSLSPPLGFIASAKPCILSRAATSVSSFSSVAAPNAAISPVPTNPAPKPLARSPNMPVSSGIGVRFNAAISASISLARASCLSCRAASFVARRCLRANFNSSSLVTSSGASTSTCVPSDRLSS